MDKIYDLCGLGNSLVDIQVNVDDYIINKLVLKKGEMFLTDIEEQNKYLNELKDTNRNLCSGGSAANTIIAFSKFGGKACYMSLLGDDDLGYFYANEFREIGIDLHASHLKTDPTGTCLVMITPDSERTMCTSLGATGKFGPDNINGDMIAASKWLYLEGYKFTAEESTNAMYKAIDIAKSNKTKIALTFSDGFITTYYKNQVADVVIQSDLIFCNENEALSFTGEQDFNSAFSKLEEMVPNVVVTLGANGSMVKYNGEKFRIPSYPAQPVDSTGAGDMYAGAFLFELIVNNSPFKAGHLGSYASGKIVSQLGARLNYDHVALKNELYDLLDKN